MHQPGIEPRANAWKAFMLPLHHWCCCRKHCVLRIIHTYFALSEPVSRRQQPTTTFRHNRLQMSFTRADSIQFIILAFLSFISCGFCTTYTSLSSLDEYGNSPQINNARLASETYSKPTIVAASGCSIIAAYLENVQKGTIPFQRINLIGKSEEGILATIGSGLASDVNFINRLLRKEVMYSWERYDTLPDCSRVSNTVSRIMLAFMNYSDEISDGTIDILKDENGDRLNIGRPLGANMAVLRISTDGISNIQVIQPSGIITSPFAQCFGKGSGIGNDLIREKYCPGMSVDQTKDLCIEILRHIALQQNLMSSSEKYASDYMIVVEKMNVADGVMVEKFNCTE